MVGGRGIRLDPESVVRDHEFFIALDPRRARSGTLEARVRVASSIQLEWLERFFPNALHRERSVEFDQERGRVVGVATLTYRDLALREDRSLPVNAESAGKALAEILAPRGRAFFEADEASSQWLARLDLAPSDAGTRLARSRRPGLVGVDRPRLRRPAPPRPRSDRGRS